MTPQLDLATVLLLQQCSYIVGFMAFVYIRLVSPTFPGLVLLSSGFLILIVGSVLAGHGTWEMVTERFWKLGSLGAGLFGYTAIWLGLREINRNERSPRAYLIMLLPAVVFGIAFVTELDRMNAPRAASFNTAAALSYLFSAFEFLRRPSYQRLYASWALGTVLMIGGALSTSIALGFLYPPAMIFNPISGFFFIIILNFTLSMFVVILLAERALRDLQAQAETDPLTGVFNRRYFFEHYPQEIGPTDAVLLMDLDHFKQINDTHGHQVGDEVLRACVSRIQTALRRHDILARYGGEEFIALIKDVDQREAKNVAERIRRAVSDHEVKSAGKTIRVTVSIGIALGDPDAIDIQALISQADGCLYSAKNSGRNRVQATFARSAA
ncbi:GGDEF domain-containing protein [uncultured Cohaesibacter sp.]|uniref:GGDEF domain-containing protein n=1 Tax=uncultured Cohaesibacter sp. TaxID=1002546 RepID=UPI0029C7111C|nr:GGDEF domain-containing protein [uncultured Cohaesibacter sp.]